MVGIISYYPNDPALRSIRKRNHIKQLKFITRVFPKEKITIVAQNYNANDYIATSRICYEKLAEPVGPASARNIILKKFYSSAESCLLLMDDDVAWYDYYDATELVKEVYYNCSKFDFELLVPLNPQTEPFKKQLFNENLKDYYTLKKISLGVCPNLMLLKQVSIYQTDFDKNSKDAINEDKLFLAEFMLNGYRGYKCLNWVKKSYDINICSIIETTDKRKSLDWHKMLVKNFEEYINKEYGLKNGSTEFSKKYNKAESELLIKRKHPYSIRKEIVPKQ